MGFDVNLDRHICTYIGKDGFANNQALKRGNTFESDVFELTAIK